MEGNKKRADARFLTQFIDGEWPYRVVSTTKIDINPDLMTENKAMAFHIDGNTCISSVMTKMRLFTVRSSIKF